LIRQINRPKPTTATATTAIIAAATIHTVENVYVSDSGARQLVFFQTCFSNSFEIYTKTIKAQTVSEKQNASCGSDLRKKPNHKQNRKQISLS
jgi:hypothetical protein